MANLALPRLRNDIALVDSDGRPTQTFQQWWDAVAKNIENSFNDLSAVVAAIAAAQASADAAQATATAAARESARLNSYPNPGTIITAADVGTDCDITIANHTRVYPVQGSIDVPDVSITGATLHGLAFSTTYWVYYDDTTLANATPTFVATTTSATAQVGAAAGRHLVGFVTTPADGGTSTGGTGGGTPGGGGGYNGGGSIP
jgi:hypothetical protein